MADYTQRSFLSAGFLGGSTANIKKEFSAYSAAAVNINPKKECLINYCRINSLQPMP